MRRKSYADLWTTAFCVCEKEFARLFDALAISIIVSPISLVWYLYGPVWSDSAARLRKSCVLWAPALVNIAPGDVLAFSASSWSTFRSLTNVTLRTFINANVSQTTTRSSYKTPISKYFLLVAQPRKKNEASRKTTKSDLSVFGVAIRKSQFAVTRLHRKRRCLLLDVSHQQTCKIAVLNLIGFDAESDASWKIFRTKRKQKRFLRSLKMT